MFWQYSLQFGANFTVHHQFEFWPKTLHFNRILKNLGKISKVATMLDIFQFCKLALDLCFFWTELSVRENIMFWQYSPQFGANFNLDHQFEFWPKTLHFSRILKNLGKISKVSTMLDIFQFCKLAQDLCFFWSELSVRENIMFWQYSPQFRANFTLHHQFEFWPKTLHFSRILKILGKISKVATMLDIFQFCKLALDLKFV